MSSGVGRSLGFLQESRQGVDHKNTAEPVKITAEVYPALRKQLGKTSLGGSNRQHGRLVSFGSVTIPTFVLKPHTGSATNPLEAVISVLLIRFSSSMSKWLCLCA